MDRNQSVIAFLLGVCTALAVALLVAIVYGSGAAPGGGVARVIDGDSLVVDGVKIRLAGIDAFERDQVCGGSS